MLSNFLWLSPLWLSISTSKGDYEYGNTKTTISTRGIIYVTSSANVTLLILDTKLSPCATDIVHMILPTLQISYIDTPYSTELPVQKSLLQSHQRNLPQKLMR